MLGKALPTALSAVDPVVSGSSGLLLLKLFEAFSHLFWLMIVGEKYWRNYKIKMSYFVLTFLCIVQLYYSK